MSLLVLSKLVPPKLGPLLRDVDPKTAIATDGRGALNGKSDGDRVISRGIEIDVLSRDLGRAVVVELQQINLRGRHDSWAHGEKGEGPKACAPRLVL